MVASVKVELDIVPLMLMTVTPLEEGAPWPVHGRSGLVVMMRERMEGSGAGGRSRAVAVRVMVYGVFVSMGYRI